MAELPLIPSTVVGSHGKPGWWFATVKAYQAGEYGLGDLDEMFDDAADTAIRDMERAGLDIITDGEVRRLDGYVDSYYAIIKGIEPLPVRRKAGPWGYDQQTRYEATGRIDTPPGGLGIVKEFEYLKAHTTRRTKATCAGPLTFGSRIHPGKMYKGVVDVAERFAEVINAELKALVETGADFIQLDEPARGNVSGEEMARLYNLATDGVRASSRSTSASAIASVALVSTARTVHISRGCSRQGLSSSCWSSPDASSRSSISGRSTAATVSSPRESST